MIQALWVAAVLLAWVSGVSAHPLGNNTVNRQAHLRFAADSILVDYLVDHAEVPTLLATQTADIDADGDTTADEWNAYVRHWAAERAAQLKLVMHGREHSASVAHDVLQLALSAQTKLPGQVWGAPTTQAPRPSHTLMVVSLTSQVWPQVVSAEGYAHSTLAPLQLPPHLSPVAVQRGRLPCGSPATGMHLPSWPPTSHASHWPPQARSQQKPSTHWPLAQSVAWAHAWPFFLRQAPPGSQVDAPVHESGSSLEVTETQAPVDGRHVLHAPAQGPAQHTPSWHTPKAQSSLSLQVIPLASGRQISATRTLKLLGSIPPTARTSSVVRRDRPNCARGKESGGWGANVVVAGSKISTVPTSAAASRPPAIMTWPEARSTACAELRVEESDPAAANFPVAGS